MKILLTISILLTSLAQADDIVPPASARFAKPTGSAVPDFQKHVVPLLGRLGCNSAKCHGSFQGRGDFRLSLFGFDFNADHSALKGTASSEDTARLDFRDPPNSLIIRKPTLQTEHEGGQRFERGSWEHNLLLRWIATGASGATGVGSEQTKDAADTKEAASFTNNIKPLLENHCYECHGFGNRKGGLSLSTRLDLLAGGATGPAIVAGKPAESLLVQAVHYSDELQMPPSGRLKDDQISDIEEWIKRGAVWPESAVVGAAGETDQVLARLHYEPSEILFRQDGEQTPIRVIAEWENGQREDVTCLARFQTNNDSVATVNRDGLVTSVGEGDSHIVAFYDNGVAAIPVLRRYALSGPADGSKIDSRTAAPIDRFVNTKLDKLGLVPSELCSDAEFLRRVSIDMTGTLPTPDEVISFTADVTADKRARKIDELLGRTAYAAWWSNKLCDFTGCNPKSIRSLLEVASEEGYVKASEWYDWVYQRVETNKPYDEIVSGIMLADLSGETDGDGMPHFWTRQSLEEPKDTAMSVAHAFLGIQLQCAECHKHPFDQWTQADFNDFSAFFNSLSRKRRSQPKGRALRLLRSETVTLTAATDPREPIMRWMRDKSNPWFARAFVNRVWAGYFNVGIVDPPDQFTPANPPSNPQLLDWLTNGFVDSGFDMKWLHRQIANSHAYQRSWKPNATNRNDRRNYSRSVPRRIPAEVLYDALKQATAANDQLTAVRTNLRRRASGHLSMRMAGTHAMKVFGKPDRSINCDCERVNEPTLLQAIFTQNDPLVRMRIADSGWIIDLEDAIAAGKPVDNDDLIKQVWLRTVGRVPRPEEIQRSHQHLGSTDSLVEGISDLMWSMLNTREFLLNH